jgi:hypothetical protein
MRIATAWFLSATLAWIGCGSSKKSNSALDADLSPSGCVVDDSKGGDSAIPLVPGSKAVGQICPRGDQDFFLVEVGPGMNLLDVNLAYPSAVTKVNLQVRLLEADGVTEVPGAVASDTAANDGKSAVVTTFAVPQPGSYVLRVNDAGDDAADNVNSYVLQVALAADPDSHEPNGTAALAKAADGQPGFISFVGDVDVYAVSLGAADALLAFQVDNPAAAKAVLTYQIADGTGKVLGTGKVPPAAVPLDLTQPAPASGILFVALAYVAGSTPDRRSEAGYKVTLAGRAETDANEVPVRNDTPSTATCVAGPGSPCAALYSGTAVTFKTQTGTIGSRGDRDLYFLRATSAPAVIEAKLRIPATAMDLALDILEAHAASPCKTDADCSVMKVACTTDDDCEWSHKCVNATAGACTTSACRQCVASGLCLPLPDSPGQSACGVTLFSVRDVDGGMKTGADGINLVQTAQPIFNAGPVFAVVHDNQDDQYDTNVPYTLDLRVVPEPDPGDSSPDPTARNNYYNPYPIQTTNLAPNRARAKDISAQIMAGTSIDGFISYQTDEDWYWFSHPCPGTDCGLVFEYVQPGPSPVRPVFLMWTEDLTLHESWTYAGQVPTPAPVTDVFGDGDCTECSFAAKKHGGPATDAGAVVYKYYLQVRDAGADDWDFAASGRYQFRLKALNPGCPASCSEMGAGTCGCFCKAQNQCPAGLDL